MKSIPFTNPVLLEKSVKKLLAGYETACKMAKADLKKHQIPFTSTRYEVLVNMDELKHYPVPAGLTLKEHLHNILNDSNTLRLKVEAECGVV